MTDAWPQLIKRYRLRHGLTQGRLATAIGVSQRTVSRWERGALRPSEASLAAISELRNRATRSGVTIPA